MSGHLPPFSSSPGARIASLFLVCKSGSWRAAACTRHSTSARPPECTSFLVCLGGAHRDHGPGDSSGGLVFRRHELRTLVCLVWPGSLLYLILFHPISRRGPLNRIESNRGRVLCLSGCFVWFRYPADGIALLLLPSFLIFPSVGCVAICRPDRSFASYADTYVCKQMYIGCCSYGLAPSCLFFIGFCL